MKGRTTKRSGYKTKKGTKVSPYYVVKPKEPKSKGILSFLFGW